MDRSMHIPLFLSINKTVSSMEKCKIVHVLNVALLEMRVDAVLLPEEVHRIKSFSLRFSDWWYLRVAWELTEAHEITPSILEKDSFRRCLSGRLVEQERPLRVLLRGVLFKSEPLSISVVNKLM